MSNAAENQLRSMADATRQCESIPLKNMVNSVLSGRLNRTCRQMGTSDNWMTKVLEHGNTRIAALLCMSMHVQQNLLNPYLQKLPAPLRETDQTRALRAELNDSREHLAQAHLANQVLADKIAFLQETVETLSKR